MSCLAMAASSSIATASAVNPWWHLVSRVEPANVAPGASAAVDVQAVNLGDAATTSPVTLSESLPPGLTVESVGLFVFSIELGKFNLQEVLEVCHTAGQRVTCTTPEGLIAPIAPYEDVEMRIKVKAGPEAGAGGVATAQVAGGGAATVTEHRPFPIGEAAPAFGAEQFAIAPESEGGEADVQAGSHPFQLTTTLALNQNADPLKPPALPRNLTIKLPPGLVGNATAIPQCTDLEFRHVVKGGASNQCPENTAVGVAAVTIDEPSNVGLATLPLPLFNLTPEQGEPARFGFEFFGSPVTFDTSVRTGDDYGVTVKISNITELASFLSSTVTFWGVPGDSKHDESRGWACLVGGHWAEGSGQTCSASQESRPVPFLTLPTSCEGSFSASVEGASWPTQAFPQGTGFSPLRSSLVDRFGRELGTSGCNRLPFSPTIAVAPDGQQASTPSGLTVAVHVPQTAALNPDGLSESSLRDTTVALPEGIALNPSGGDGLEACSEGLAGFTGFTAFNPEGEPGAQTATFTPTALEALSPGVSFCPDGSKIGRVKIKTPLLDHELEGAVYLATQNANPFGSLIAMYMVVEDPVSGSTVKLTGEVHLTETGQIVTTFKNTPDLPFEDLQLHFFGGERAPLATPSHCGSYAPEAIFTPWSGQEPVGSTSTFNISSGPNRSPCPGANLPFSPSLMGGTTNINAGAFSALTTTIGRADGQQNMQSVQLRMPPGLSGILAGVKLCPEAQANEGTCGPESLIGETTVSAGVGSDPVTVKGGRVFITETYAGAPFGLSIVNPVKAGPLDLEHDTANPAQNPTCDCVVVRAKIEVDPTTAALTITTDPTGPHSIPHMIDGVPVQIQKVNVLINRPDFAFNPTNCNPASITGSISSDEGASSLVSVPFQITNCATLKFAPKFSVSTSAHPSKAQGASLTARLAEPPRAMGSQANITKVKVELPKQLPSRLTTLQKACTSAQFRANPAGCPAASIIGHAVVHTPLLPVALEGPAIFVSHGGEAFPSLVIVLQGYGATVDLVGTTYISKAGVTSTTFKTVPDVPFSTFALTLPQGRFSALGANLPAKANGSFCGQKLVMPTEFIAQNGAQLHQRTSVSVTGCARKKALTRKQKLAKVLNACKTRPKGKRAACVRGAHRNYGRIEKRQKKKKK